ncbi:hypothetical protein N7493_009225 [Penicillium malachiteum]|uniref:Uncharacterized protein n=1 Tax=Penicillium malachiteum TaxID=1324776 RepID=A0AAD6MTD9_9EURO|nr:hypothetical protein N7493_009225 [Penicillium malachiteum]
MSNSGGNVSESNRALRTRRTLRPTESMLQSQNNFISSPRTRHSSIEVSTYANPIPRTAEELASAVKFLDAAREAGRPWPEVADEYAEIFRVKRSAKSLSLYLSKNRAPLRNGPQPQTMSSIPVSTMKNWIPMRPIEKKEGGKFVDNALSAGHHWDKVRRDYALEFGVCRAKVALGHLRNKYLKSIFRL